MSFPASIDTANAESHLVVANTPAFLAKRLLDDAASESAAKTISPEDLVNIYRNQIQICPLSLRDLTVPYICLAALYRQQNINELRLTAALSNLPDYKWLQDVTAILIAKFRSNIRTVKSDRQLISSGKSSTSTTSISFDRL